jgi:hypothetical protein
MPTIHSGNHLSRHAPTAQPGDRPSGYVHKSATFQREVTAVTIRDMGRTTDELVRSEQVSGETIGGIR